MVHAVESAGAAHRVEIQEEAAHHFAESKRCHRQIDSLQPQGRKTDDYAGRAGGGRRDHKRRSTGTPIVTVR